MGLGLRIEVVWSDEDLVGVRVGGSNERFSGQVDAYSSRGAIAKAAKDLAGFPSGVRDSREIVLGAFGPEWAGGAARLRFSVVDPSGHAVLDAEFESDAGGSVRGLGLESARLHIRFEAATLDRFVSQLTHLASPDVKGVAVLEAIGGAV